jgi:hypothetical protein
VLVAVTVGVGAAVSVSVGCAVTVAVGDDHEAKSYDYEAYFRSALP